ncbi:MAG: cyclic nucleotide-binding domain-containing protein [Burkholderiales bacterium]|jgi:CRP-like cAMP-binding protein|nr:cyclic nucleotide-binding domain-containing protein [Burkholderiales bacterium]
MNEENFYYLRNSKLSEELSESQCRTLANFIESRDFKEGEVLVKERTVDDHLYVIVSGSLSTVKNFGTAEQVLLNNITAGSLVGELGFMDGTERYASLIAAEPSKVLRLKRGNLESLLDTDPRIVYCVMRAILRQAHQIQYRQSMQQQELTNYIYKQQGRY